MKQLTLVFIVFLVSSKLLAGEYYVATTGSDSNPGTKKAPFKTIQKAATVLKPGDVCIVREGTYREWVKPLRGGESESNRITYKAAPGENVIIKGSEQIKSWVKQSGNVWMAEIPDTFFGSFNPFKKNISGGWIKFGNNYHLGDVYLNGKSYREMMLKDSVSLIPETFYIEAGEKTTRIYANFKTDNPNEQLTEINVRECCFFPEIKGLGYITVDGFTMMQAAANWTCFRAFQHAIIGTYYGRSWIIENCHFSDARCTAIVCGNDPSSEDVGFNVDSVGCHIIRNNEIRRCGQAGIHGFKGWAGSIIEGNLIEDICVKREFGGLESGAMKLHDAVDVIIRNNIIRRVYAGRSGQYVGIWIDWGAQGVRITGNIVYDLEGWALFLQNAHGPVFVDNNIFSGAIMSSMGNSVYAHNLLVNCTWRHLPEPNFSPVFWKPHTAIAVKLHPNTYQNDKKFNNIYVGQGMDQIPQHPGFENNWNIFYEGARKSGYADDKSIIDSTFNANVVFKSLPKGVEVEFNANKAPFQVKCPLITYDFIGKFELMGQGFEDSNGNPLSVNTDILGNSRSGQYPVAGPLETLQEGKNLIKLTLK